MHGRAKSRVLRPTVSASVSDTRRVLRRVAAFCGGLALVTVTVGWLAGALAQPSAYSSAHDDTSDLGAVATHNWWIFNQIGDNLAGILVVLVGVGLWTALSPSV